MCEAHRAKKPEPRFIEDIFPARTLDEAAVSWGLRIAAISHYEDMPIPGEDPNNFDGRTRAVILSIMRLADPTVRGSEDVLQAIIKHRRENMN